MKMLNQLMLEVFYSSNELTTLYISLWTKMKPYLPLVKELLIFLLVVIKWAVYWTVIIVADHLIGFIKFYKRTLVAALNMWLEIDEDMFILKDEGT